MIARPLSLLLIASTLMITPTLASTNSSSRDRLDESDPASEGLVEGWLKDLSSKDVARRRAAIDGLSAAGAAVAPRLARVVGESEDDGTRLGALESLSRNPMAYAYTYVLWDALPDAPATDDEEAKEERRIAWNALVRAGDTYLRVGEYGASSDHYCDLLESAETELERASAILGLGRAGRRRAAEEIFTALTHDEALVRQSALAAISVLRWGQALPYLKESLEDGTARDISALIEALSYRDESDARAIVARNLEHVDPEVQAAARGAMARHDGYLIEWRLAVAEKGEVSSAITNLVRRWSRFDKDLPSPADTAGERNAPSVPRTRLSWTPLAPPSLDGRITVTDSPVGLSQISPARFLIATEFIITRTGRFHFELVAASDSAVFLDGRELEQSGRKPASLKRGRHRLAIELPDAGKKAQFSLRVKDESGKPVALGSLQHIRGLATDGTIDDSPRESGR